MIPLTVVFSIGGALDRIHVFKSSRSLTRNPSYKAPALETVDELNLIPTVAALRKIFDLRIGNMLANQRYSF